jgi:hypothetical protein
MSRRIVLGILLAIVLIAGAVGLGLTAYNYGVAQGLADSGRLGVEGWRGMPFVPFMHYGWGFRPFGFGFGFLGCLFPLFFFLLLFLLIRGLFWRPWGWRGGWGGPWGHGGKWEGHVPPAFEEWHKRAHAQGEGTSPGQEPPAQAG